MRNPGKHSTSVDLSALARFTITSSSFTVKFARVIDVTYSYMELYPSPRAWSAKRQAAAGPRRQPPSSHGPAGKPLDGARQRPDRWTPVEAAAPLTAQIMPTDRSIRRGAHRQSMGSRFFPCTFQNTRILHRPVPAFDGYSN